MATRASPASASLAVRPLNLSKMATGFDHRIGHFRSLRTATRVLEYHIYLRSGRFDLENRLLGVVDAMTEAGEIACETGTGTPGGVLYRKSC
jgi:hypothetical protein